MHSAVVLRIATNPRILERPASIDQALKFVEGVVSAPNCVRLRPGPRHWSIFIDFCWKARVRGGGVTDANIASLAIESGSEWRPRVRSLSGPSLAASVRRFPLRTFSVAVPA
jgi:predicted nucleic acid-binding protein